MFPRTKLFFNLWIQMGNHSTLKKATIGIIHRKLKPNLFNFVCQFFSLVNLQLKVRYDYINTQSHTKIYVFRGQRGRPSRTTEQQVTLFTELLYPESTSSLGSEAAYLDSRGLLSQYFRPPSTFKGSRCRKEIHMGILTAKFGTGWHL